MRFSSWMPCESFVMQSHPRTSQMVMQKIILIVFITLSFYIVCNGGRLGSRTLVPICLVLFRRNHGEPSKKAFKQSIICYEHRPRWARLHARLQCRPWKERCLSRICTYQIFNDEYCFRRDICPGTFYECFKGIVSFASQRAFPVCNVSLCLFSKSKISYIGWR